MEVNILIHGLIIRTITFRYVATELSTDIVINVLDVKFHLHKVSGIENLNCSIVVKNLKLYSTIKPIYSEKINIYSAGFMAS